jgi:transposase
VSVSRRGYPSDLTDAQWALIEPLLPEPSTGGRPEKHPRREIVNAILYVVRSGCPWRYLPADLPPWQTVYWYFTAWVRAAVQLCFEPLHRPICFPFLRKDVLDGIATPEYRRILVCRAEMVLDCLEQHAQARAGKRR